VARVSWKLCFDVVVDCIVFFVLLCFMCSVSVKGLNDVIELMISVSSYVLCSAVNVSVIGRWVSRSRVIIWFVCLWILSRVVAVEVLFMVFLLLIVLWWNFSFF